MQLVMITITIMIARLFENLIRLHEVVKYLKIRLQLRL